MNDDIDLQNEQVIVIEYDNFNIEYNQTNNTYISIYTGEDDTFIGEILVLEGKVLNEDNSIEDFVFDEDTDIFGYLLTVNAFNELKKDINNCLH